jgi:TIR domain
VNPRVFLSYTGSDETAVQRVVAALKATGITVWFAPADLSGGDYLSSIHEHIRQCDVFMVALSQAALNSRWVQHEINTALALQLDGRPLKIIPVLLERVRHPLPLADLVPVDLVAGLSEARMRELIAAARGERVVRGDVVSQFRSYVESLIRIDTATFGMIIDFELIARRGSISTRFRLPTGEWIDTKDTNARQAADARATIRKRLADAGILDADVDRALSTLDAAKPLPVVGTDVYSEARDWIRRFADEQLIMLAAALRREAANYTEGVTLEWLATFLQDHRMDKEHDDAFAEWQAESLASRAKAAGLLARSTEWNHPRTYAHRDAEVNPSFDMGPMVWSIGFLADRFQQVREAMERA